MEQDPGGSQASQPQQSVTASGGFSVWQVVQLAVEGNYESHIVLNYNRSDLDEKEAGQAISPVNLRGGSWKNVRSLAPSVHHLWKDSGLG